MPAGSGSLTRTLHTAREVWRHSARLRRAFAVLVAVELIAIVLMPAVLPSRCYLHRYLDDPRIERSVESFFKGESFLEPDAATGWRNRPNVRNQRWIIDGYGGRHDQPVTVERTSRTRILFLGSSKINGGTQVDASETVSAYLARPDVETLNFGTMLYGPDQSYLAYTTRYARFDADVVVLGIDSNPEEALESIYVPLRRRTEVLMPFVKPRFTLADGRLSRIDPPLDLLRRFNTEPDTLLRFLDGRDGFFSAFERFRRFGFTPLAHGVDWTARKVSRFQMYFGGAPTDGERLLVAMLSQFRVELAEQDKRLVLLLLPDGGTMQPRNWLPEPYRHRRLARLLGDNQFEVVDPRAALQTHGGMSLFHADGVHYTAGGNKVIAADLAGYLAREGTGRVRIPIATTNRTRM
jgi:hypothetical protein